MRVTASRVKCPKCQNSFRLKAAKTPSLATKAAPNQKAPQTKSSKIRPATLVGGQSSQPPSGGSGAVPLGLVNYTRTYFRATRWSLWLWLPVALLMVALLSFLKPVLPANGLFFTAATMIGVSVAAMTLFVSGRVAVYLFKSQRTLPPKPRSWMARVACGGLVCSIALFVLAAAENFTPDEGLLVAGVQTLKSFQVKLLDPTVDPPPITKHLRRRPTKTPLPRSPTTSNLTIGLLKESKFL